MQELISEKFQEQRILTYQQVTENYEINKIPTKWTFLKLQDVLNGLDIIENWSAYNKKFGFVYAIEYNDMLKIGASKLPKQRYIHLLNVAKNYSQSQIGKILVSPPHINYFENETLLHKHFNNKRYGTGELFEIGIQQFQTHILSQKYQYNREVSTENNINLEEYFHSNKIRSQINNRDLSQLTEIPTTYPDSLRLIAKLLNEIADLLDWKEECGHTEDDVLWCDILPGICSEDSCPLNTKECSENKYKIYCAEDKK